MALGGFSAPRLSGSSGRSECPMLTVNYSRLRFKSPADKSRGYACRATRAAAAGKPASKERFQEGNILQVRYFPAVRTSTGAFPLLVLVNAYWCWCNLVLGKRQAPRSPHALTLSAITTPAVKLRVCAPCVEYVLCMSAHEDSRG